MAIQVESVKRRQAPAAPGEASPRDRAAKVIASPGPAFAVIRTKRIFEEICDQVRGEMVSGALRPGDKLPAERDLAIKFGVSRPAVREALRGLEVAGIVSLHKGVKGGAYVTADPGAVTRSLRDMYHLGRLPLDHLTEARTVVMRAVVELAAMRIDEETLASLEANVERLADMPRTITAADRVESGADFYRLIAQATGNAALQVLVEALTTVVLQQVEQARPRAIPNLVAHRKRLVAHLRAKRIDEAKAEIVDHLRKLHVHLLRETKPSQASQKR